MFKTQLVICVLIVLATPGYAEVITPDPAEVISAFHETLILAMQVEPFDDRRALIEQSVRQHFMIETIARISLGRRNWQALDPPVQAAFVGDLRQLVITTYAARFDHFNDQTFNTGDTTALAEDRFKVKSVLNTKLESVNLDYQLQLIDGQWRIYDIVANGVSDLSLKRSNYTLLFKQGGLDAVRAEINSQTNENVAKAVSPVS